MTTYTHIATDGTITQIGALPRLWHDGSRWWDFRDPDPAWPSPPPDPASST